MMFNDYEIGKNEYSEEILKSLDIIISQSANPAWIVRLTEEKLKCEEYLKKKNFY